MQVLLQSRDSRVHKIRALAFVIALAAAFIYLQVWSTECHHGSAWLNLGKKLKQVREMGKGVTILSAGDSLKASKEMPFGESTVGIRRPPAVKATQELGSSENKGPEVGCSGSVQKLVRRPVYLEWSELKRRWVKGAQEALSLKPWTEGSLGEVWSRRVKPSNFVFRKSLL